MLKNNTNKALDTIHDDTTRYIEMMRGAIRINQINQQENKLRVKQDLVDLKEAHRENLEKAFGLH